jgi:ribonuclease D
LPDSPSFKWITTDIELQFLALNLELETVFAMDFECNNSNSYLGMICLWQISTVDTNYIVDTLLLYSSLNKYLGPVMSDDKIMKIVLGGCDLLELQRDFKIYCQGVVDVQEVYNFMCPEIKEISLKNLVASYLGIVIDKLPQVADWRIRPLPQDLIDYACNDSYLLLKCWYLLMNECDMSLCSFERSKQMMLKLYKFPQRASGLKMWRQSIQKLPIHVRNVFDNTKQSSLFVKLYEWREQTCKLLDLLPIYFCPNDKLALITRAKPSTVSSVHSIHWYANKWPVDITPGLLKVISDFEIQVEDFAMDVDINSPFVAFRPADYDSVSSNDEWDVSLGEIVVRFENDIIMDSPPEHSNSIRSGQNLRNYIKRQNLRKNRRERNLKRLGRTLPPIRYYRNRGLKNKQRSALVRSNSAAIR